jgi:putative FmdB family regulatory protein
MPLYEYVCRTCDKSFELLIRGDDTPTCPHCQSRKLDKLLSVVAGHVAGGKGTPAPAPGGCSLPQCGLGGCGGMGG